MYRYDMPPLQDLHRPSVRLFYPTVRPIHPPVRPSVPSVCPTALSNRPTILHPSVRPIHPSDRHVMMPPPPQCRPMESPVQQQKGTSTCMRLGMGIWLGFSRMICDMYMSPVR